MALYSTPIRRSLVRPLLLLGGDRELVLLSGLLSGALIFTSMTWFSAAYGLLLWFGGLAILRGMAMADPLMRNVYLRHRLYRKYYPPRSTPWRMNRRPYL